MSLDPPPTSAPLTQQATSVMSADWVRWILALWQQLQNQPILAGPSVTLTDQHASIAVTPLPLPILTGGTYRLSWTARITTAATTSSSLTITLGWVEDGIVLTASGAAITGNTTTTVQSGSIIVHADQGSALTYATTYASNPAGMMQYELSIIAEQL